MVSSVGGYLLPVAAALLLAASAGCRDDPDPRGSAEVQPAGGAQPEVSLTSMTRCLESDGIQVGEVQPRDARQQALHDLAQRTSFEATRDGLVVVAAVSATTGDAQLLAELLQVPDDPYRVVVDGNVVVMYERQAEGTYRSVVRCARR